MPIYTPSYTYIYTFIYLYIPIYERKIVRVLPLKKKIRAQMRGGGQKTYSRTDCSLCSKQLGRCLRQVPSMGACGTQGQALQGCLGPWQGQMQL